VTAVKQEPFGKVFGEIPRNPTGGKTGLLVTAFQVGDFDPSGRTRHAKVLFSTEPGERPGDETALSPYALGFVDPGNPTDGVSQRLRTLGVRMKVAGAEDSTYVDVEPKSKLELPGGRRVYVHQDAFAELASQSEETANLIYGSLMQVNAVKIAHHHLSDAVDLGIISEEVGDEVLHSLEANAKGHLTSMLQHIGYRSPSNKEDVFPLLESDEVIEASCFEGGYFTYATGVKSGEVMFAEQGSLQEERQAVRNGRGPIDLTMITKNLILLDPSKEAGLDTASFYFPQGKSKTKSQTRLQPVVLDTKRESSRRQVLLDIATTVNNAFPFDPSNEDHFGTLRNLYMSVISSLEGGIFKTGSEVEDPRTMMTRRRSLAEQLIAESSQGNK
jgi:hypothetical protein